MNHKALFLTSIIALGSASFLASCSGNFKTPFTDKLTLAHEVVEGERFTNPSDTVNGYALGEVTVAEVVDGDTFNFYNGRVDPKTTSDITHTVRFEGVNTPESTARIEPWGVKASQFVKSILWDNENHKQKPYSVVIQNDISVFGQLDNTSSERFIGFVWYKMDENSAYRLLNLEIIEQCYSVSTLNLYSEFCPYLDVFNEAYKNARESKRRVNGEKDPGYDYTNSILDVSIKYIIENYENLGVSSTDSLESSDSGVKVRVTGVILAFSGDSIFVRDVTDPYEDGTYASIYAYTALTVIGMSQTYKVGQIISFVAKATTYHNNIQLTDVKDLTTGSKDEKITVLLSPTDYGIHKNSDWQDETKVNSLKQAATALGYGYDVMPYDIIDKFDQIGDVSQFSNYVGDYVKIKLTVRPGDENDEKPTLNENVTDYYRLDSDEKGVTIFAKNALNVKMSIRSVYIQSGYYGKDNFKVGSTYVVMGQIAKYYDTYQIVVPNRACVSPAYYSTLGYVYLA